MMISSVCQSVGSIQPLTNVTTTEYLSYDEPRKAPPSYGQMPAPAPPPAPPMPPAAPTAYPAYTAN